MAAATSTSKHNLVTHDLVAIAKRCTMALRMFAVDRCLAGNRGSGQVACLHQLPPRLCSTVLFNVSFRDLLGRVAVVVGAVQGVWGEEETEQRQKTHRAAGGGRPAPADEDDRTAPLMADREGEVEEQGKACGRKGMKRQSSQAEKPRPGQRLLGCGRSASVTGMRVICDASGAASRPP